MLPLSSPSKSISISILLFSFLHLKCLGFDVSCQQDAECADTLKFDSSKCVQGKCTNPFHSGGCLNNMAKRENSNPNLFTSERKFIRECNSDDLLSNSNDCSRGPFQYDEVIIAGSNWETSILLSWIMQIFLSEVLEVPVVIENLVPGEEGSTSFYDINGGFTYPAMAYNFEALKNADDVQGDCKDVDNCAHLIPEAWVGASEDIKKGQDEGYLLPEETNGMIGKLGIYIPTHTAKKDWSLTTYHGLQNDRAKMAERFGRPTSFSEYCANITTADCTNGDEYAARLPEGADEPNSYYVDGIYSGYFEKDDCSIKPNCTGYFVNAPCSWSTIAESQMFWNNISVVSDGPYRPNNGYTYSQMLQILSASNKTKDDIMIWWFSPDMTNELYFGQESALYRVQFPEPTRECIESRPPDKCSYDLDQRLGNQMGACDYELNQLNKIISSGLLSATMQRDEINRSPALDFIRQMRIPPMAMESILQQWVMESGDPSFTARDVICQWVYDNADYLQRYIPNSYPRTIVDQGLELQQFIIVATTFGVLSIVITFVALAFTIYHRKHTVILYSKIDFLYCILIGFLIIAIASVIVLAEPTFVSCTSQQWAIALGYTLQFIPLLLKIAAINKITRMSMQLRRVNYNLKRLKTGVFSAVIAVIIYLSIWTLIDPSTNKDIQLFLDETKSMVVINHTCASRKNIWKIILYLWEAFQLISILVLTLQSQTLIREMDESQALTLMVYTHILFLVLRLIVGWFGLSYLFNPDTSISIKSLLLSWDTILCVVIYFGDKARRIRTTPSIDTDRRLSTHINVRSLRSGAGSMRAGRSSINQFRNIFGTGIRPQSPEETRSLSTVEMHEIAPVSDRTHTFNTIVEEHANSESDDSRVFNMAEKQHVSTQSTFNEECLPEEKSRSSSDPQPSNSNINREKNDEEKLERYDK